MSNMTDNEWKDGEVVQFDSDAMYLRMENNTRAILEQALMNYSDKVYEDLQNAQQARGNWGEEDILFLAPLLGQISHLLYQMNYLRWHPDEVCVPSVL